MPANPSPPMVAFACQQSPTNAAHEFLRHRQRHPSARRHADRRAPLPQARLRQGARDLRPGRRPADRRHRPALGLRRDPARRNPRQGHRADADEPLVVRADAGTHPQPSPARPGRLAGGQIRALPRPAASQHGREKAEAAAHRMRRAWLSRRQRLEFLPEEPARSAASGCPPACGRPSACPTPSSPRPPRRRKASTTSRSTTRRAPPSSAPRFTNRSSRSAWRSTGSAMSGRPRPE